MKKMIALLLTISLLLVVFAGCSAQKQETSEPAATGSTPAATEEQTPAEEQAEAPAETEEAAAASPEDVDWPKLMSLGTAATGGAYYNVGVAIGKMLESHLPTSVTVEITAGALENPVLIDSGDLEIGFTNEHIAYAAVNGTAQFEGQPIALNCLAAGLQPGVVHFAVLNGSGIETLSDLKGKTIAVGAQGNGSLSTITTIFDYFGISWDDFTPSYMSYSDGCQALVDGTVDCAIVPAGVPNSSIQTLAAAGKDYKLLSWSDEERDGFLAENPFYASVDLQPGTYEGQDEVVNTIATANIIIVSPNMDENESYWLCRTLWENIEEVYAAIPALRDSLTLENATKTTIDIAPGALRYYQEVGAIGGSHDGTKPEAGRA